MEPVGFWSYSTSDNESSKHAILRLADDIRKEYDLLTGQQLTVFIDRESIDWGEAWRERIDARLSSATFFIPILTPRYFNRPECRHELQQFMAQAESLGLRDFILPIVYIPIPGFDPSCPDELMAAMARTQSVDWTDLRLKSESSEEVARSINSIAVRLLEISQRLNPVQLANTVANADEDRLGLADLLEESKESLSRWRDVVIDDQSVFAQAGATMEQFRKREHRMIDQGLGMSAINANRIRMARHLLPLARKYFEHARAYSAKSIELDPVMTKIIRLVGDHPEDLSLVAGVLDAVDEANFVIRRGAHVRPTRETVFPAEVRRLSKVFHDLDSEIESAQDYVLEGNAISTKWHRSLSEMRAYSENTDGSDGVCRETGIP
jgi:hypothetical protein